MMFFLQLHTFFPRDMVNKETLRFAIDNQDSLNSAIFGGYIDCRRSRRIGAENTSMMARLKETNRQFLHPKNDGVSQWGFDLLFQGSIFRGRV